MDILLKTDLLFTARDCKPQEGFVGIKGNKIAKVGSLEDADKYIDDNTEVFELYGKVISPGFVDNHVFFTGYMWQRIGFGVSNITSEEGILEAVKKSGENILGNQVILGHGLKDKLKFKTDRLNELYKNQSVVVFSESREYCFMNQFAEEKYGFSSEECYAEACWKLFDEILKDQGFSKEQYYQFQDLLASKGITSIKEIGFDDYSGFTSVLKELEDKDELKHRVNLVSQPVARDADFIFGEECRALFADDKVRFMGYNIMVDGDIESGDGDLLEEYKNQPGVHCNMEVDYEKIEKTVLKADKRGFRCALHGEGDAAVRRAIDIYEKCRLVNGKRDARHAIVDMELIDPADRKRLRDLDISAIQYIQIMNCYGSYENYWDTKLLQKEQIPNIWAYHSLLKDGARLCFGTDFPLDVPNIPLSIRFGTKRLFPDGTPKGGYHLQEALTPAEILTCWSRNGQEANFEERRLGTIEEGKLADIAVIDTDIFHCDLKTLNEAEVCLTIFDGKIIYTKIKEKDR